MRIIGGKDWWDGAMSYGIDPSIVYVRKSSFENDQSVVKSFGLPKLITDYEFTYRFYNRMKYGRVIVGDHYFPFCIVSSDSLFVKDRLFVTSEELIDHINHKMTNEQTKAIENFMVPGRSTKYLDLMIRHKSPILLHWKVVKMSSGIEYNPLNTLDYGLQKYMSANEVYMEVYRYISGVFVENRELVTLSDTSKIQKAGFDVKKSFRKEKQN